MALTRILLLLLLFPAPLLAQYVNHPLTLSRDDASPAPRAFRAMADSIRVLAVMVQFQPDNDSRTTGTGQFVLTPPTDSTIDAPPRNRRYFEDHLTFLANYYRKASRGKTVIRTTVIDSVFTLPAVMAAYSPARGGPDTLVAKLARDTWKLVDASGRVPDFSLYDCFIVFHAGSGRDVDLVASLGYDPTPYDIPSLYVGLNAFRKAYGSSYQGIPVNNGTHFIQNSIVVPETDSRTVPGTGGDVLLELSINGLLCASVGSYLGLPDLFDTNTGLSGIGRFGLMDGQSIFSFSGLFPPEPSAWERYWLGWISPITVPAGTATIALPAVGLSAVDPARVDTVYRIPISNQEYFLVENRNRDPLRNGQTVFSTYNGVARQQLFPRDTTGFNAFDITKMSGTITDVEDFDWSLPGGVDDRGTFFDGGVLIWHIDESVIAANIGADAVNADPQRRGVDVEEADGSQDIGQSYGFTSAGSGSEEGTALDFWYRGNSSPVNKNIFSPTSYPNSNSNSGANSHITIRDFSIRGPNMSAVVVNGDAAITPLAGFPKSLGEVLAGNSSLAIANLVTTGSPQIVVATYGVPISKITTTGLVTPSGPTIGKIYAWRTDTAGGISGFRSDGLLALSGNSDGTLVGGVPAVRDMNGDGVPDFVFGETVTSGFSDVGAIRAFAMKDANHDSLADTLFTVKRGTFFFPPVIGDSLIAVGGMADEVYFLRWDGTLIDSISGRLVTRGVDPNTYVVSGPNGVMQVITRSAGGTRILGSVRRDFGGSIVTPPATGVFRIGSTNKPCIAFRDDELLYLVDASLQTMPGFPVNVQNGGSPLALADIDGDGSRDIVTFAGSRIYAYSSTGVLLDHFPISVPAQDAINSFPIVADIDGDGLVDIVGATRDGVVFAYNRNGTSPAGFPLQGGRGEQSLGVFDVPLPSLSAARIGLAVASGSDGSVSAWYTGSTSFPVAAAARPWPQYQHDAEHSGADAANLSGAPISNDFFPKNRAYNWPNPVYDSKTFIRYYVKDDATVNVKVFDLAGDLVTQFPGPGVGGFDNEIAWDVSSVQSGIYLARIEATGSAGSGVAIIKIAVVK